MILFNGLVDSFPRSGRVRLNNSRIQLELLTCISYRKQSKFINEGKVYENKMFGCPLHDIGSVEVEATVQQTTQIV